MITDLEHYYSLAKSGDLACILHHDSDYGDQYLFTRIIDAHSGKISTSYGVFWGVNGEKCDHVWHSNGDRLVVPNLERLKIAETRISNVYQFGIDRKYELACARAILERRLTKMPDIPPPPVPTPEEAEAELREAMQHWIDADKIPTSPGNSGRVLRDASERLSIARRNFCLSVKQSKHRPDPPAKSMLDNTNSDTKNHPVQAVIGSLAIAAKLNLALDSGYKPQINNFDSARYTINLTSLTGNHIERK